jgi:aminoglycoside phosphotransferase (APT) family kinase protein
MDDRKALQIFVEELPLRFAEIASCGLPDTLVRGDFHPGNLRGDRDRLTLLDWGDSGVGHPLLDQPAFLERQPFDAAAALKEA